MGNATTEARGGGQSANGAGRLTDAADPEAAAEALGPEAGVLGAIDPISFGQALFSAGLGALLRPRAVWQAGARYAGGLVAATAATGARALGADGNDPVDPPAKDRRFADPTWRENPTYRLMLQSYLLSARLARDLLDAADLKGLTREKASFAVEQAIDAAAPTNFLWGNPAVRKKAFETGGASLVRGLRNFLSDVADNGGMPRQVEPGAFTVGEDLAVTPGKVVFRNDLMELIQYAPQTETVHETPLLLSPPWINKYYIMDLAPGRSFVEWAVTHGHTVFVISYRNPDASLSGVRLDDYLVSGPTAALDVVRDITGSEQANLVGLCLGGTLTAMLQCKLASDGEERVRSATLLNTLVDFRQPGVLGAFTDPRSVAHMERKMAARGYLDGAEMAGVFTFMRANDLVWNYAVNNWLMGEPPPAFDLLTWNADSTRMPAAMHSFYVRSCYVRNDFARGEMELAGTRLDPGAVRGDMYVLAAREDHITPWRGSYLTTQVLPNTDTRFVLSSSGHIAGIVNPPGPKGWHRVREDHATPEDPEEWLAGAEQHQGSWWEDWAAWIADRAGPMVDPPAMGSERHPPVGDAPGSYVKG